MKKYLIFLMMAAAIAMFGACSPEDENEPEMPGIETPETPDEEEPGDQEEPDNPDNPDDPNNPGENPDTPESDSKILVAYFSWGGTTQRMAQEIASQTGADLFRIEPTVPYPTDYTECTPLQNGTTMHVRLLPTMWKIGNSTMLSSSVAPFGGIQLR